MKRIILLLLIFSMSLFAKLSNENVSQKLIDSKIPIVDIRTPAEWRNSGLLKNAIPIMFFNEHGAYDVDNFLHELNSKVDTTKPFAIICHTGNRTSMLAPWLSKELKYDVINLTGGMDYATRTLHLKTYKYIK